MKSLTLSAILASLSILIPFAYAQSSSDSSSAAQSSSITGYSSTEASLTSVSSIVSSTDLSSTLSSTSSSISTLSPAVSSSTVYIISLTSTYLATSSVAPVPQPSISPVGNYYFAGCYLEPDNSRALSYLVSAADNMTVETCAASCAGTYQYFGLEFGRECWCGYTLGAANKTTQDQCHMPCGGSSSEFCGASNILTLYSSIHPIAPPPKPLAPQVIGGYTALGCYTEASNYQRALTGLEVVDPNMTNEICATACTGYLFFGTEYSNECFCGNSLTTGAVSTASSDCSMKCAGNSSEACGGPNRLDLYFVIGGVIPTPPPVSSTTISSTLVPSSSSIDVKPSPSPSPLSSSLLKPVPSSTSAVLIQLSSLPSQSQSLSSSSTFNAVVSTSSSAAVIVSSSSSTLKLSSTSTKLTSTIASTSARTTSSSTKLTTSSKSTFLTVTSTKTSSSAHPSGTWASVGCFQDTAKHLMNKIFNGKTMNVEVCISAAAAAATAKKPVKYLYIGLENGQTCYGATALPTATSLVGPAACTVTCAGNKKGLPVETCGGKLQYNMYASLTVARGAIAKAAYAVETAFPVMDSDGDFDGSRR